MQEPTPIEKRRKDVPPKLAALKRLLAKLPEQRPATPAESRTALAPFCQQARLVRLAASAAAKVATPAEKIETLASVKSASVETVCADHPPPTTSRRSMRLDIGASFRRAEFGRSPAASVDWRCYC